MLSFRHKRTDSCYLKRRISMPMRTGMVYFLILSLVANPIMAQESQGEATTEVEQWKTRIEANSQRVENVSEDILSLRTVFGEETVRLGKALGRFRNDPNNNRRPLQEETAGSLLRIVDETDGILDQREDVLIGGMEVERYVRDRAAHYRSEGERLDESLPSRQSRLAQMTADSDALKREFADSPNDRAMKRQLWRMYRDERRLTLEIQRDQRQLRLMAAAADRMDNVADGIIQLTDALEITFDNIELAQIECRNNAELLSIAMHVEGEVETFTGGVELGVLLTEAEAIGTISNELMHSINEAMDVLLAPEPTGVGGPTPPIDTDFDRWLKSSK